MAKSGKKAVRVAIHQPGYHRYCGYFFKMLKSDLFISLDTVQFVPREWQNRQDFYYRGQHKWLTVPVEKGRDKITNKKTANSVVVKDHWEYIKFIYARTPYFKSYQNQLGEIYAKNWVLLNDLCLELIMLARDILGIKTKFVKDSDDISDPTGKLRKANLLIACIKHHAYGFDRAIYLPRSGPIPHDFYLNQKFGGSAITELEKFPQAGIEVEAYFFCHPIYRQHQNLPTEPFIPNLSIFDLIFNCGPESLTVLKSGGKDEK